MTTEQLLKPEQAGVCAVNGDPLSLLEACETAGFKVFDLRLDGAATRKELLKSCYKTFKFPEHFGRNWDALRDCLFDLDDADGYAVWINETDDLETDVLERFLDVLREVAEMWRDEGRPFWAFCENRVGRQFDLPWVLG